MKNFEREFNAVGGSEQKSKYARLVLTNTEFESTRHSPSSTNFRDARSPPHLYTKSPYFRRYIEMRVRGKEMKCLVICANKLA